MSANRKTLLCRYRYDPLDRLADCTPSAQARTQRFYLKERLTSEVQGAVQRSIFQQDNQLLAQQQRKDGTVETSLLATDQQRSVLHALDATQPHPLAYTPYGHRPPENGLLSLLGFNGERPDPVTGHYLLGNGYRAFNPVLMRFNSPDSLSPFGKGGVNSYAYCLGDPINLTDPTGQFGALIRWASVFETITTNLESIIQFAVRRRPGGFLGYAQRSKELGYTGLSIGTVLDWAGNPAGMPLQTAGAGLVSLGSGMEAAHGAFNKLRKSRPLQALARRVFGNEPTNAELEGVKVVSSRDTQTKITRRINIPALKSQSPAKIMNQSNQSIRA